MDVRCNRCATEYEFDDALISERGTTVKCTNCGYQFKVFPSGTQSQEPERWVVRTASGEELVYTSLRELQRGIAEQRVGPNDLLSRGRQLPRALGAIAELEPFFSESAQKGARPARTLTGVAPAAPHPVLANASVNPPQMETPAVASTSAVADPSSESRRHTQPGLGEGSSASFEPREELPESSLSAEPTPALPPVEPVSVRSLASGASSTSLPISDMQPVASQSAPLSGREYMLTPSSPFAAAPIPPELMPAPSSPYASGPISAGRRDLRSYDELTHEEIHEHGRRARSRWIAAFVIAGVTTLFALTVGRRYLLENAATSAQETSASSARVAGLLREGNRLLAEGDVDSASEQLLRASALAEKDHAVLAALAHLETLRADISWLKLRLLDPELTDLVQATHRELGRRVGRARIAADAAFAVAPEDMVVLRARIDTLRLSGDADKAREWIKPIAQNPSDPQNAYVLAALDLSDPNPGWGSVVDRLRVAVSGERNAGRAHAALIYALARGGKLAEAQSEFAKLETSAAAPLLQDELRGFLKRYATGNDASPSAPVAMVDPVKLGKLDTSQTEEPKAPARGPTTPSIDAARASSGDFRKQLADAAKAVSKGSLAEAETLYERVLTAQPNATEALAGLAEIARRRHDTATATRLYERVLANNPNYLPALMARGDQEWDAGNQSAAVSFYKRVIDQSGSGSSYGQRAAARIAEYGGSPADKDEKGAVPSAPEQKASDTPEIDTSDLPGFK